MIQIHTGPFSFQMAAFPKLQLCQCNLPDRGHTDSYWRNLWHPLFCISLVLIHHHGALCYIWSPRVKYIYGNMDVWLIGMKLKCIVNVLWLLNLRKRKGKSGNGTGKWINGSVFQMRCAKAVTLKLMLKFYERYKRLHINNFMRILYISGQNE